MHAVAYQKLNPSRLTSSNHLLPLLGVDGHGFFADHVLARLGKCKGVLLVQGIGSSHIDRIDIFVVLDLVYSFVGVAILSRNRILLLPLGYFGWSAADDTH